MPEPVPANPQPDPTPAPSPAPNDPPANPNPAPADPKPDPAPAPDPAPNPDPKPDPEPQPSAYFTEKWREEYANGDEKVLKQLQRFSSPKQVIDSMLNGTAKINELAAKLPPGDDAKPEEVKAYREAQGIPEESGAYWDSVKLPEGTVLSDDEKAGWQPLLDKLHGANVSPDIVNEIANEFIASEERTALDRQEQDKVVAAETEAALRQEMGADYNANKMIMNNLVNHYVPEAKREAFLNARLMDGTPVFADADMSKMFMEMGRLLMPQGTVVTTPGADNVSSIQDQLKAYQKEMGTNAWFKDEKKQEHYRQLVSAYKVHTGKEWDPNAVGGEN